MAVSRAMRRLLRVLEMQEEQARLQMESALAELRKLERALDATGHRERVGRQFVKASAAASDSADRLAGVEESRMASRQAAILKPKAASAGSLASERRGEFLGKRVERRQAETVIAHAEERETSETGRRVQRELDEWFLGKSRQEKNS
jgi:hypothetical protein